MLNCSLHRSELDERVAGVRELLAANRGTSVARQTRGLSLVLLYGAYENLLTSLSRSILETAVKLRVGNKRLRPGLQLVAAYPKLRSVSDSKSSALWKRGADVIELLSSGRECTIEPNVFPNDGSNFKKPQVQTFCNVYGLPNPAPILQEVWIQLEVVVTERNEIAHGQLTPEEVGRRYSADDMDKLVDIWHQRWTDFIDWVESAASYRDFYRLPR